MYAFQYHRPQSVADAAKLLAGNGDAKIKTPHDCTFMKLPPPK